MIHIHALDENLTCFECGYNTYESLRNKTKENKTIRDLAKKLDKDFNQYKIHEMGNLESALFVGGSNDGFWDAIFQLESITDPHFYVNYLTPLDIQNLNKIRESLSLTELTMLSELRDIMNINRLHSVRNL